MTLFTRCPLQPACDEIMRPLAELEACITSAPRWPDFLLRHSSRSSARCTPFQRAANTKHVCNFICTNPAAKESMDSSDDVKLFHRQRHYQTSAIYWELAQHGMMCRLKSSKGRQLRKLHGKNHPRLRWAEDASVPMSPRLCHVTPTNHPIL